MIADTAQQSRNAIDTGILYGNIASRERPGVARTTVKGFFAFFVFFVCSFTFISLLNPSRALAWIPATVDGNVYMMVGGVKVYLPGAEVYRMDWWNFDYCGGGDCWGDLSGVHTIANTNGHYNMGNNSTNPPHVCWGSFGQGNNVGLCPSGEIDKPTVPYTCPYGGTNWCGFNCGSNPHRWRAYFPTGYSWVKDNYPFIPFKDGLDAGGTWKPVSDCGTIDGPWYEMSVGNDGGHGPCDFEWIPSPCVETTTQPALSNHMLYCFSGYPDSCVELSQDPNNPTLVYPPRPGGGGYVGIEDVIPPNGSRGMFYDVAMDDMSSGSIFGYDGWSPTRFVEVTSTVLSGHTYHVKGKDAALMTCDDRYWCAGDGNPADGEGPCSEVHGYFRVTYPPTVDNVSVVLNNNVKCMLPPTLGAGPARWTGRYGLYPDVSNPIDLEVIVSDLDGWSDIDTVWLDIARTAMSPDYYCKNELISYVSAALDTKLLLQGFSKAVALEVASGSCQPNFCNAPQGTCGGECMWDVESNLTVPDTCNCKRNFVSNPFNPMNPRYNYDEPSCQLRYIPGVAAECHSCKPMTDHPNYQILNVIQKVISATQVAYTFTIRFNDSYPEGIQQFYAMAQSGLLYSGVRDGGYQPRRTTNGSWIWGFDFHEPSGNISLSHIPNTPANRMQVTNTVGDGVSGVRHLYDRRYWVERGGVSVQTGGVLPIEIWYSGQSTVSEVSSVDIPNLEGEDWVFSTDTREDIACNVNNSTIGSIEVGPRWIQTIRKDVYGYLGFDDPIPLAGTALSQYWIGGGTTAANFGSGISSSQVPPWYSSQYLDANRNAVRAGAGLVPWYEELLGLALISNWIDDNQNGLLRVINLSTDVPDIIGNAFDTGIYILDDSVGTVTIPSGTICSGRKIIFLPGVSGAITMQIEPDFLNADAMSACLFVVKNGVVKVGSGIDKPEPLTLCDPFGLPCLGADTLATAFITDDMFDVDSDLSFPRPDRLEIFGFVFSDSANFGRDMLWEDNWVLPTGKITYDPRYYQLLDEMLGRRPYSEMECGIVKQNSVCENWVEIP